MKITNEKADELLEFIKANIEAPQNPRKFAMTELQKKAVDTAVIVGIQLVLGISIELVDE